jgi:hypothetical protein
VSASARIAATIRSFGTRRGTTAVAAADRADLSGNDGSGAPAADTSSPRRRGIVSASPRILIAAALALIVAALAPAVASAAPGLTFGAVTNVETTKAHVAGTIDPDGVYSEWSYELSTDGGNSWTHSSLGGSATGNDPEPAEGTLENLAANTTYQVRLAAYNFNDFQTGYAPESAPYPEFTTDPAPVAPTVTVKPATEVSYTKAKIQGQLDPEGGNEEAGGGFVPIHWSLELTSQGEPFSPVASGDLSEAQRESSNPIDLPDEALQLTELHQGRTYHYKLVAIYAGRPPVEDEWEFETLTVAKPTLTAPVITAVTSNSAHFSAEIEPGGTDPAFETSWHFECVKPGPSCGSPSGAPVPAGSGSQQVGLDVKHLDPHQTYHVVLVATNAGGESKTAAASFETGALAPTLKSWAAGPIAPTTADINAQINPNNSPTTYWFEWGTSNCATSSCASTPHLPAGGVDERQQIEVQASEGTFTLSLAAQTTTDLPLHATPARVQQALEGLSAIGSGNVTVIDAAFGNGQESLLVTFTGGLAESPVELLVGADGGAPLNGPVVIREVEAGSDTRPTFDYVYRHLSGLQPGTTYHYRVIAENAVHTTTGSDQSFTTAPAETECPNAGMPGTNFLPDCRGYEMVSPTDKNGTDVVADSFWTWAAEEGEGVSWPSINGFGDAKATGVSVQYVSRRTATAGTNGWSSHAVTPLGHAISVPPLFLSNGARYQTFSPDLKSSIYLSWQDLHGEARSSISELYRIRDLEGNQPQEQQLLSESALPINLNHSHENEELLYQNTFENASSDLSHVFFESAFDLTGDGHWLGSYGGEFYEYADGTGVRNVGRIPTGVQTECDDQSGSSGPPCEAAYGAQAPTGISTGGGGGRPFDLVSSDGSRVLFEAPARSGQLYLREGAHRTFWLNASEVATPEHHEVVNPAPQVWAMSRDGSRIFFTTTDRLVSEDEDGRFSDLYMYEPEKPVGSRLTLLSNVEDASPYQDVNGVIGSSADGHYVYFTATGQFVSGEPKDVQSGLYLWHDGAVSYIGSLTNLFQEEDNESVSAGKTSRITADGRYLLFMTQYDEGVAGRGGYPGYDNRGCGGLPCRELYLYSAESGHLICVSCNPAGTSAREAGDALTDVNPGISAAAKTQHLSHALSQDGQHVFFTTTEELLPEDTNGVADAYEYDVPTGERHLISSGTSSAPSYFMDASPDGKDVYFDTRQRLVGWDNDTSYDIYDARVDGGLPEPVPVPTACQGESCRPSPKSAPTPSPTPSQSSGPGNPKPNCPSGKVKKHGKCVKKQTKPHGKKNQRRKSAHKRGGGK